MKITQGFEQSQKIDGFTVYKLSITKNDDIVQYGDASVLGKTFILYTDNNEISNGDYLSVFLPKENDIKQFAVEDNFKKMKKLSSKPNQPYTENPITYSFKEDRKCYLFFKGVQKDFYLYMKVND